MIAAPVQCDVDGIPKGLHYVFLKRANVLHHPRALLLRASVWMRGLGVVAIHSITWTACLIMDSGIVTPSAFAVLRFTAMSKSFGPSTGRSTGLAPLTILSTNPAVRR